MDLRSAYPYWLLKSGIIRTYPSLDKDLVTDVAIVGAGITGALVAWHLSRTGIPLVVLEKRHIGMGSTAASTSILQYEIDTPLVKLKKLVGTQEAIESYLLCKNAIYELADIAGQLGNDVGFDFKKSFQFASRQSHVRRIEEEYEARTAIGIELEFLDSRETKKLFQFSKPGGLLSKDGGQVDAYRMTHGLLRQVHDIGNMIFDHSPVTSIKYLKNGIEMQVNNKFKIKAKKLIIACGYESQKYIPKKIESIASTYAIISEPFIPGECWYKNALIWETAMPYLYLQVTADNRILVGGRDVLFYDPTRRDALLTAKSKQLQNDFKKLFPGIDFRLDFRWAGTFSSTKDGLPFIGTIPERPHTYFALGFGGNGITFSQIAGRLISAAIRGEKNAQIDLFSFNR